LFVGRDQLVNAEKNFSILESINNENIEIKLFPKANHVLKKTIEFRNTPLGIWLLSTIVVGLISFAYKNWKEKLDEKKDIKKQLTLIDDEIDFRTRSNCRKTSV